MMPIVRALLAFVTSLCRSRLSLQLEIVALRHQLTLHQRSIRRPQVRLTDLWSAKTQSVVAGGGRFVFLTDRA